MEGAPSNLGSPLFVSLLTTARQRQAFSCETARQRAYEVAKTPAFARSRHERRKVEALFAELKNQIGSRRLRLRRMRFVREQFYLAAAVQNLKRLVRFLTLKPQPTTAAI